MQTAWTNIRPVLIRRLLLIGIFIAFLGILLLLLAKIYLPPYLLIYLGLPITLLGATLIALGLRPYRALIKLEKNPHEIKFNENGLHFYMKKNLILAISFDTIKKIEYIDQPTIYGIGFWLNRNIENENPITKKIHQASLAKYGCDYFLPYFSRNVFENLISQFEKN